MDLTALIITLLIGAVAGWLAGVLFKGFGFGLLGNIIIGLIGGFIGGNVLNWLGVSFGGTIIGQILTACVGAVLLLCIISLFKKN